MKHLKKFGTESAYNSYIGGSDAILPNVSLVTENQGIHYNSYEEDWSREPLTFEIKSDGYFWFSCDNTAHTKTIQYNINGGEWTTLTSDDSSEFATAITVNGLSGTFTYGGFDEDMNQYYWENNGTKLYYDSKQIIVGDYVYNEEWDEFVVLTSLYGFVGTKIDVANGDIVNFKGDNATYASPDVYDTYKNYFNTHCNFIVEGNIMSLIDSTNFVTATTLASSYTFYCLFNNCTGLTSAENLVLPATTLASSCYEGMFAGCTSLTTTPELPATTLTSSCYSNMFSGCISLTTAPELPATTLAYECYYGMFNECTALTTTPELPATTLANNCYQNMFYGCTSLATAPELPATTLANYCYYYMFEDCTSLTTAPELPATTLRESCYDHMFNGCISLTTAPELPATTLAWSCYQNMFSNCTSLTTVPELPATTLAKFCYRYMFRGCTSLNYIKCLATNISASSCTTDWVYGVASRGTFVKNASMSSWTTGVNGIPTNWTVQDAS